MTRSLTVRLTALTALAFTAPQVGAADPTFEFYGHINFGLFNVDDGTESETFFADNDTSNTRIGLLYSYDLGNGAAVRFNFETGLGFASSSEASIDDNDLDIDLDRTDLRKLEVIYETPTFGTFYVGQGSMSADDVTESDLSETGVVAYTGTDDLAASFAFRPKDGAFSGITVGDAFSTFDGSRRLRLRYDTPSFNGFTGSISYGEEELDQSDDREFTDIALRYSHDFGDVLVDGQLGYQWIDDDDATDEEVLGGSIAMLHKPTGVSMALASSRLDEGDESYYYVKLGYQQDWFALGTTALSIDLFEGSDYAIDGSDSTSWGLAAVQFIDAYNMELYASYRTYEFDATGTDFEDIDVLLVGARWKF